MALTPEELAQLRKMIDEASDSTEWSDTVLSAIAAQYEGNLRATASSIWETKAASYVEAINISESGSSRQEAAMFEHAMAMARTFGSTPGTDTPTTSGPRSTRIVRPGRGERG